jgi:hypothetical protein
MLYRVHRTIDEILRDFLRTNLVRNGNGSDDANTVSVFVYLVGWFSDRQFAISVLVLNQ